MEELLNIVLEELDKHYKSNGALIVDAIIDFSKDNEFDIEVSTAAIKAIYEGVDERVLKSISEEKRKEYFKACYNISSKLHAEITTKLTHLKNNFAKPAEKPLEDMSKEELIDYIKNKK